MPSLTDPTSADATPAGPTHGDEERTSGTAADTRSEALPPGHPMIYLEDGPVLPEDDEV